MSLERWKRLLLCAVLELAALTGAPLRPKDIEIVLRNATAVVAQKHGEDEQPGNNPTV